MAWTVLPAHRHAAVLLRLVRDRLGAIATLSATHPEGAVLRLPRRRIVVISEPEQVRHVLVENARGYAKGLGQAEAAPWLGRGVLTAEGLAWNEQRPLVATLLTRPNVHLLVPQMIASAEASVVALGGPRWRALDCRRTVAQYTTDVLALALGTQAPAASGLTEAFDAIQRRVMFDTTTQGLVPAWVRPVDTWRVRRHRRHLEELAGQALAGEDEPGRPWATPERLLSLWLAGFETTAATLGWALIHLSTRPDLQRRLATEAETLVHASAEHPPDLPLAQAVFRETVRVRPPVWLISRRALEEDTITGNAVRRGDDVVVCVHGLQRDQAGNLVHGFDPEHPPPGRSLSFGQGPRACPGGRLADLEGAVWLAAACRNLELRPATGAKTVPVARMSQVPSQVRVEVRSRHTAVSTAPPTRGSTVCRTPDSSGSRIDRKEQTHEHGNHDEGANRCGQRDR